MDFIEYSNKAIKTVNMGLDWRQRLANAALGISGEGGEVADLIKKHLFQGHDLPIDTMAKELGDLLWYINLMADCIGFDLEQIAEMNIDKLYSRYKDGVFTEQQSINRKND